MINILCNKQHFIIVHPRDPHIKITVDTRPQVQSLPDWAAEAETFKHAVAAGLIAVIPPVAPVPAAAPATDEKQNGKKPAGKGAN